MNDVLPTASRPRPSAGRPTREQAEQRHIELLDLALELFLDRGFELATIDAIAASVGMTKRTLYSRYEDKRALFRAAVQRAIEQWIVPIEALRAVETSSLKDTLTAVARIRMRNAVSPAGLRLQRILNAEAYRFPEIFHRAYEQGSRPTIDYIAEILTRHAAKGEIGIENAEVLATAFLSLTVGGEARAIVWGRAHDPEKLEERIRLCVDLFLNGVRTR